MIAATLIALVDAGRSTLAEAGLSVQDIKISPFGAQEIAFTRLAVLTLTNGTVRRVSLGADRELSQQLKPAGSVGDSTQTFPGLCEHYLADLLATLPQRRAEGSFQVLDGRCKPLYTRGMRAYGMRLRTDHGALYLVAELIAQGEIELIKGTDFESSLVHAHLPFDFPSVNELAGKSAIDGALLYLHRMESDIQFELSAGPQDNLFHSGVLWDDGRHDGQRCMQVLLPGLQGGGGESAEGNHLREQLVAGEQVSAHCSIKCKHFVFTSTYLGPGCVTLTTGIELPCQQFSVPQRMEVVQRRRTFRIEPRARIVAEIELVADPGSSLIPPPATQSSQRRPSRAARRKARSPVRGDGVGGMGVLGQVADLSFSGVRVIAPQNHLCQRFAAGDVVYCRMVFPGEATVQLLPAQIRRISTVMLERDEWQDSAGLEFLVRDDSHRRVIEFIRQYVLAEQRAELARRVSIVHGSVPTTCPDNS